MQPEYCTVGYVAICELFLYLNCIGESMLNWQEKLQIFTTKRRSCCLRFVPNPVIYFCFSSNYNVIQSISAPLSRSYTYIKHDYLGAWKSLEHAACHCVAVFMMQL